MSDKRLVPFDFSGGLTADSLRNFFTWCARNDVSDIHLQGGNHIIVSRFGRLLKVSEFRVEDAQLPKDQSILVMNINFRRGLKGTRKRFECRQRQVRV